MRMCGLARPLQDWENSFIAQNISQRQLLSGVSASSGDGEQAQIKGR